MSAKRLKRKHWLLIAAGALLLLVLLFFVGRRIYWHNWYKKHPAYCAYCYGNTSPEMWLSDSISLRSQDECWSCGRFIFNENTQRIINRTPLLWVRKNDDSLAVAAMVGKRGFINRFTGEVALPFIYTRAWVFSDGMAAVTDTNDRLFFINHKGSSVFDTFFPYNPDMLYEGYVFHGGHCIITDRGKYGLIDTNGVWAIEPRWDHIFWRGHYWELKQGEYLQLLDSTLGVVVPKLKAIESREYHESGWGHGWNILVEIPNKPSRLYTSDGRLLSDNLFARVEQLYYSVDNGNTTIPSACMFYMNQSGQMGLLDMKGHMLTDATYDDIDALSRDLFRATITCYPNIQYILLNADGKEVK